MVNNKEKFLESDGNKTYSIIGKHFDSMSSSSNESHNFIVSKYKNKKKMSDLRRSKDIYNKAFL